MRSVSSSTRHVRGFTLVEIMTSLGLSVLVFAAVASMMLYGSKSAAIIGNYSDMSRYDLNTLDQMTTDIRQANKVLSCSSNQLQIQAVDISSGATNTLTYTYSPSAQTLTRIYEGVTNTLLSGIVTNSLRFAMFQRNPIGGSVSNYATTNAALCKVVQLTWSCSRTIIGVGQTESVQSAEVVIRKE